MYYSSIVMDAEHERSVEICAIINIYFLLKRYRLNVR